MGKRRWLPKSDAKAEAINPTDPRLLSRARKKLKDEEKKVKRLEYNRRRREQRGKMREELKSKKSQAQVHPATEPVKEESKGRQESPAH